MFFSSDIAGCEQVQVLNIIISSFSGNNEELVF